MAHTTRYFAQRWLGQSWMMHDTSDDGSSRRLVDGDFVVEFVDGERGPEKITVGNLSLTRDGNRWVCSDGEVYDRVDWFIEKVGGSDDYDFYARRQSDTRPGRKRKKLHKANSLRRWREDPVVFPVGMPPSRDYLLIYAQRGWDVRGFGCGRLPLPDSADKPLEAVDGDQ